MLVHMISFSNFFQKLCLVCGFSIVFRLLFYIVLCAVVICFDFRFYLYYVFVVVFDIVYYIFVIEGFLSVYGFYPSIIH